MSGNDIFEMDSMAETEEMEADTELGMIDEEVGEITASPFARDLLSGFCDAVWTIWDTVHLILDIHVILYIS